MKHELNASNNRPAFTAKWFWDFDYNKIDWQASYKTIIARIIERGSENEWNELTRFYGEEKVINTLKNEITFLPDYAVEEVSIYFGIRTDEMLCVANKRLKAKNYI